MLKLTKTGIGLLTKQYRSVLRKCFLLNLGLFSAIIIGTIPNAIAATVSETGVLCYNGDGSVRFYENSDTCGSGIKIATLGPIGDDGFGIRSNAIGSGASATSPGALALVFSATALNSAAMAVGDSTVAKAAYSVALGKNAVANNARSVALGYNSSTSEIDVISVGHKSTDLSNSNSAYGSDYFRRIVNVAAGTADHDVVILKQLNDALNYYYTFRGGERVEVIEFTEEFRSNKKEMSSLDFMPIKSSSDLRINLIKAEDPLTFSAKTRDDSLVLMEVRHA